MNIFSSFPFIFFIGGIVLLLIGGILSLFFLLKKCEVAFRVLGDG